MTLLDTFASQLFGLNTPISMAQSMASCQSIVPLASLQINISVCLESTGCYNKWYTKALRFLDQLHHHSLPLKFTSMYSFGRGMTAVTIAGPISISACASSVSSHEAVVTGALLCIFNIFMRGQSRVMMIQTSETCVSLMQVLQAPQAQGSFIN